MDYQWIQNSNKRTTTLENEGYKNLQEAANAGWSPISDPTVISADSLKSSPTINYKTPNDIPVYPVDGLDANLQLTKTAPEEEASDLNKRLRDLNSQLMGESSYRAEQEKAQGMDELLKTQTDLSSRLKALQNEAQAIPLQLQQEATGRGITAGGLAPLETARLRTNAIQALGVSSLLEASRGNITTAQTLVDRAVAQKYDPIKEEINTVTENLRLIMESPEYSLADKNRAAAQLEAQEAKKAAIAEQEQEEKSIMGIATEAAQMGADALTLKKIQEAGSLVEATRIAAEAGVYQSAGEQFTLSSGQSRYDAQGNLIAQAGNELDTSVVESNGRKYLINNQTGETIKDLGEADIAADQKIVTINGKQYIQNSDGTFTEPTLPIISDQEKVDKSNDIINAVNNLLGSNYAGIVGDLGGRTPEFFISGENYDALTYFNNLKSLLTVDNLGIMKGVLSDADIKILTQAATPLHRRMQKETFEKELKKIKASAGALVNSNNLDIGEIVVNDDGTYFYKQLDGSVHGGLLDDNFEDKTVPKLNLDFNMVGSDTNEAVNKALSVSNGVKEGQCGRFVNKYTGLGLGDSYQSKMAKMDKSITYPEAGMVFVMPYKNTGHTGFIKSVNNDGTVTVVDSNFDLNEKVKTHKIAINQITGLRRV